MSDLEDDTFDEGKEDDFDGLADWLRGELQSMLHIGVSVAKNRARRLPRLDDKASRITFAHSREYDEWFGSFLTNLRELHRAEVAAAQSGRCATIVALELAIEILNRIPSRHDLTAVKEPLGILRDALSALDSGHVHPLLERRPRGRGRRASPREVELKLRSVLASKALIEAGLAPADADRRVADAAAPAAKVILGLRPHYRFTSTTVRGWREKFQAVVRQCNFKVMESDAPPEAWAEDAFRLAKLCGMMEEYTQILFGSLALEYIDVPLFSVGEDMRRQGLIRQTGEAS